MNPPRLDELRARALSIDFRLGLLRAEALQARFDAGAAPMELWREAIHLTLTAPSPHAPELARDLLDLRPQADERTPGLRMGVHRVVLIWRDVLGQGPGTRMLPGWSIGLMHSAALTLTVEPWTEAADALLRECVEIYAHLVEDPPPLVLDVLNSPGPWDA